MEGEELAINYLKKDGYKIIERNYRSPFGEIDIIAISGDVLVFVEVKRRDSKTFGNSLSAITEDKKKKIVMTALYYLKKEKKEAKKVRFDVVGIDEKSVKIVKNAFTVDWT